MINKLSGYTAWELMERHGMDVDECDAVNDDPDFIKHFKDGFMQDKDSEDDFTTPANKIEVNDFTDESLNRVLEMTPPSIEIGASGSGSGSKRVFIDLDEIDSEDKVEEKISSSDKLDLNLTSIIASAVQGGTRTPMQLSPLSKQIAALVGSDCGTRTPTQVSPLSKGNDIFVTESTRIKSTPRPRGRPRLTDLSKCIQFQNGTPVGSLTFKLKIDNGTVTNKQTFNKTAAKESMRGATNTCFDSYSLCCGKGKVILTNEVLEPPLLLKELITNKHPKSASFIDNIRRYNSMFAFTSMGGKQDTWQTCKVCPTVNIDTENKIQYRIGAVSNGESSSSRNNELDYQLTTNIPDLLDEINLLVQDFRMGGERIRGLKSKDHHDVISRVFKIKLDYLMKELKDGHIFGRVKGGLPHCHILLWLETDDKITTTRKIDEYISAEIPNKDEDPEMYQLVTDHMMHGPCGADNPSCPCTIERNDGNIFKKSGTDLHNGYAMPYNPGLLRRYHAHINIEWCNQGKLYYLRVILNKARGPMEWDDLKKVDDVLYPTYRDACYAQGLLQDDKEYIDKILGKSLWGMGDYLRSIFVMLFMTDNLELSDIQRKNICLSYIECMLRSNNRSLKDIQNMPYPDQEYTIDGYNILIYDETSYNKNQLRKQHVKLYGSLTKEQKGIYSTVMDSVENNKGGMFFVYSYGGTEKTYLYKTMSAALRSKGNIVLNVASSGIASFLLEGERTAHSCFDIPINVVEDLMCHIAADSDLADLIRNEKVGGADDRESTVVFPDNMLIPETDDDVGDENEYESSDFVCLADEDLNFNDPIYTTEFLNDLRMSGIPNHRIKLKISTPIMLMRNINQRAGLCNGTRLQVLRIGINIIEAKIISGGSVGTICAIPRMVISPTDTKMSFKLNRGQFPIQVYFATTINKSQGQTLSQVGLFLRRPVFSHGQLYVAVLRVKSKKGLKVFCSEKDGNYSNSTSKVVYKKY
uniref:ATP-dependent DNA helicase n=1 Tax=Tanacetum cinerariifolium TaxID=118510 RepID=A0A699H7I7_TANCI|nr:ATP-dependent DNA helicase PIF1-like [Tanacetum cinerariifolium]